MTGPILVPLDGSQLAERALPMALSLAQHFGVGLLLLRVTPLPEADIQLLSGRHITMAEQETTLGHYAEEYLRDIAQRVVPSDVGVTLLARPGHAGECIARVAEEHEVAYLVMSSYSHTGVIRWALGSVAERVLRLARCPLIVIPPQVPRPEPVEIQRMVVPLDGSPLPEEVLPQVRTLAHTYGAEVLLFRAIPTSMTDLLQRAFPWAHAEWSESRVEEAHHYLQGVEARLQAEGMRVRHEVSTGAAADAILHFAESVHADLIAMSSHARAGMSRALLGSVTDRVVRAGECPVLVIRPG